MPPRTRTKTTKVLKENIDAVNKNKVKLDGKILKPSRMVLADKTNSLSDNASLDVPVKPANKSLKSMKLESNGDEVTSRRKRRLPPRYLDNQTFKGLSNSKDSLTKKISKPEITKKKTPAEKLPTKSSQDAKNHVNASYIETTESSNNVSPIKMQPIVKPAVVTPQNDFKQIGQQVSTIKYLSSNDNIFALDASVKPANKSLKSMKLESNGNEVRSRRKRRLPPRYLDNQTLKGLSNSKDSLTKKISKPEITKKKTPAEKLPTKSSQDAKTHVNASYIETTESSNNVSPIKMQPIVKPAVVTPQNDFKQIGQQVSTIKYLSSNDNILTANRPKRNCRNQPILKKSISKHTVNASSSCKTASKELKNSLVANRPNRVHRLPSRFEDHSISPNKFIPVQPCHASTPIQQKNAQHANYVDKGDHKINKKVDKPISKVVSKSKSNKNAAKSNSSNSSCNKSSPDTNNNGKKVTRPKRAIVKVESKQVSPNVNKITQLTNRLLDKSLSFRLLEDKKSDKKSDVYDFTFDPNEEPLTQKKKRKRPAKTKLPKPKPAVFKYYYNDNISKALKDLKSRIKPSQTKYVQNTAKAPENHVKLSENHVKPTENATETSQSNCFIAKPITSDNIPQSNVNANIAPTIIPMNASATSVHTSNYASVRIEDIAADIDLSTHQDDINYSPVNSPYHQPVQETQQMTNSVINKDPLNLQEDLSFFEDPPVSSSSMNISVRHPLASPWRVEFGELPMKWHNNTYVKANMTPAVESSFINSEQAGKKKHVYTNLLPQEPLPEIFENTPALKQTSIISFIREVVEKSSDNKRMQSLSSTKNNYIFDDSITSSHKTPKKAKTSKDSTPNKPNNSNTPKDKDNSTHSSNKSLSPEKAQEKDKDCTYFGFDETGNYQENVSPVKTNPKSRTRGLRSRKVLQDLTQPTGAPMAVLTGIAALVGPPEDSKLTSNEVLEQIHDQLKSVEDAQAPEIDNENEPNNMGNTVFENPSSDEDSNSVHLFEDIEVVHHLKAHRKSYGKATKVTFQQSVDSQPVTAGPIHSSDEDDLADLTFHVPNVKQKKTTKRKPKNMLTKKEEKEVEEWAAGFNSMCEDIDEFPLLVE